MDTLKIVYSEMVTRLLYVIYFFSSVIANSKTVIDLTAAPGEEEEPVTPTRPSMEPNLDSDRPNMSSSDIAQRLAQSHFEFTLSLYSVLVQVGNPCSNMAFSPLLVSTLLTPTLLSAENYARFLSDKSKASILSQSEGAHRGRVFASSQEIIIHKMFSIARQIQRVLNFNELSLGAIEAWHMATVATLQDKYYKSFLQAPRGLLVYQRDLLTKEMDRTLGRWFGHTFWKFQEPLGSSSVLQNLNRWSKNSTNSKVNFFLQENFLRDTKSLILSPGAIQSMWLTDFDPNNTFQKGLFYRSPDDRFEIPMMINRLELPLGYSHSLEARVLELPFQVRRAALFIILPDHLESGLTSLESNLTSENVRSLLSTLKMEVVNLRIPKFHIESTLSLVKALKMLGAKDLFREASAKKWHAKESSAPLQIDEFLHRIRFEVQESSERTISPLSAGSSSKRPAGPTVTGSRESFSKFGEKYFEVDHPFVFFLWDYLASTIICMGRVVDPRVFPEDRGPGIHTVRGTRG